jgi:hypothetical protein
MAKLKWKHFIVITPALVSCHNHGTYNPPRDYPPTTFGPREDNGNGTCYVQMSGNPPAQIPVSCTAPLEKTGTGGCVVESAQDPNQKVGVVCEPASKPY